jgi:NDP-sugar pyrophosphorylase family protein
MVKVAGRPILERIILHLVGFGIKRIFISINYLGEVIQKYFGDGSLFGCKIDYLYEDQPLGSGGSISLMPELPIHPFLVLNGDLITQFDVDRMLRFHSHGKFLLTMAVYEYLHTVPYGVVEISENNVKNIHEKPTCTWLVNAGIYVFEPSLVERIPKDKFFPLTILIQECLDAGDSVGAFYLNDDWIDIGRKEELEKASGR